MLGLSIKRVPKLETYKTITLDEIKVNKELFLTAK